MPEPIDPRSCTPWEGHCLHYWPGHDMFYLHARELGRRPWGWRDGVVEAVDGGWLEVRYLHEDGTVRVWHHTPLGDLAGPGTPVRVHEGLHALRAAGSLFNVLVAGGLGPVPEPANRAEWAGRMTPGVVDIGTGRGLVID